MNDSTTSEFHLRIWKSNPKKEKIEEAEKMQEKNYKELSRFLLAMDLDGQSESEIHKELCDHVGSDVRMSLKAIRKKVMTNQLNEKVSALGATLVEALPSPTD